MYFVLLTEEAGGVASSCHQHLQRRYLRQEHLPPPILIIVFLLLFRPSALLLNPPPPVHLPTSDFPPLLHLLSSTQAHLPLPQPTFLPIRPSLCQIPDLLYPPYPGTHRSPARLSLATDGHSLRVTLLPGPTRTPAGPFNQVWISKRCLVKFSDKQTEVTFSFSHQKAFCLSVTC